MDYKLSAKRNGKWWNYGSVKKNQYENLQASFKVTKELLELLEEKKDGWVNFAMFEEKPKSQASDLDKDLGDTIPF